MARKRQPSPVMPPVAKLARTTVASLEEIELARFRATELANVLDSDGSDVARRLGELERYLLDVENTARTARGRVERLTRRLKLESDR